MGGPTAHAKFSFPVSRITPEIRKDLAEYYGVTFDPAGDPVNEYEHYDEAEVDNGIFTLDVSEARDGELPELEDLLVAAAIPFDRETSHDWQIMAVRRIFRPGVMDKFIYLDGDGEEYITLAELKKFLVIEATDEPLKTSKSLIDWLDEKFAYPPLS